MGEGQGGHTRATREDCRDKVSLCEPGTLTSASWLIAEHWLEGESQGGTWTQPALVARPATDGR
jgi:hypothetical protein